MDTSAVDELSRARRRFVLPAGAVFVVGFGSFLVLFGYARHFMATRVVGAFTWAYVLSLAVIVLVWGISFAYLRYADRVLAPLADRATGRGTS
jgi:uncharacterized membrane protein (DUF485 family)